MSLAEAKKDLVDIIEGDFGVEITITNLSGQTLSITGLASKHHIGINPDTGEPINTKNAHCSLSEKTLTDNGYAVRDSNGEISLKGHKISFKDSSDIVKQYRINETFPDETLGLIVCILGDQNG